MVLFLCYLYDYKANLKCITVCIEGFFYPRIKILIQLLKLFKLPASKMEE